MMTRRGVAHQYGAGGYAPPPYDIAGAGQAAQVQGARPPMSRAAAPAMLAPVMTYYHGPRPYVGMDITDPSTWTRPYNPRPGTFARLHSDQAAAGRRAARRGR